MQTYTPKEAARLLNISVQTLRRWERTDRVKCIRTQGNQRRFSKDAISELLGIPAEKLLDLERERQKEGISESPLTSELKERKREVVGLRLDIEKEKATQTLDQIRRDKEDKVKQAKDQLEILKIEREMGKLEADKKVEENIEKRKKQREVWEKKWVRYGDEYLDSLADVPCQPFPPETVPLLVKVQVRREVTEALKGVETTDDPDRIRLLIYDRVNEIWADYKRPIWKNEAINSSIAGLAFPLWLDSRIREKIISEIKKILEERVTGLEDYEEVNEMGERFKNEMVRAIEESRYL